MKTLYYYQKAFWTGPPYDKKAQEVPLKTKDAEAYLSLIEYKPGWWIRFQDRQLCKDIGSLVGRVLFVHLSVDEQDKLRIRYEITHGYTQHAVGPRSIECRMRPVEE